MRIFSQVLVRSIEDFEALIRSALRERMRRAEPSPEVKTVLLRSVRLQQQRLAQQSDADRGVEPTARIVPHVCPELLSSQMWEARFFRRQLTM